MGQDRVLTMSFLEMATDMRFSFANEMCGVSYARKDNRQHLGKLLARLRRWGCLPYDFPSVDTLADQADRKFLRFITQCPSHILRHLLKEKATPVHTFIFILPLKENRNFISWALYHAVCPLNG